MFVIISHVRKSPLTIRRHKIVALALVRCGNLELKSVLD